MLSYTGEGTVSCLMSNLLFYMMHKKSLHVKGFQWQKRIHLCSRIGDKRAGTCVYPCPGCKNCVSHPCTYPCFYIYRCMFKVNNRARIRAGYSAVLRGHCSSGIRNGETKGVSPGVKCLESKGASEFFEIFFFSFP